MTNSSSQSEDEDIDVGAAPGLEASSPVVSGGRLTRLKINRFRHVKPGTELRFDDGINVLLGRNGTGKTTLLDLVCALVSGGLAPYQNESFDLEFEVLLEGSSFAVSVQNNASPATSPIKIASKDKPKDWRYCVAAGAPSGTRATAHVSPRSAEIVFADEPDNKIRAQEVSPFVPMFYVHQFNQENTPLDIFSRESMGFAVLSILCNCLRLDEGLDIFRASTHGAELENFGPHLSIRLSSKTNEPDTLWYVPFELASEVRQQNPTLHTATEIAVDHTNLAFLGVVTRALNVKAMRLSMMLLHREQDEESGVSVSTFGKPSFWVTSHRGVTITHDQLSYGEKRLLAFMYHAAANPLILVADELVNGLHHEWIQACLDAIQGQAFLTSQNPLLLDHLPFSSAEEVQRRFVLCDRDEQGNWIWRNMSQDAANAFFRAYEVGLQHVSEILETSGLW